MANFAAKDLAGVLAQRNLKIVLAESCTGGLAAALLTGVPGISEYFCGSAVTYRATSKSAWLGIDKELIDAHTAESPETTLAMAIGILDRTPEADWSAAVTGHLGPNAPPEKDGRIFIATAQRSQHQNSPTVNRGHKTHWQQIILDAPTRAARQTEAAQQLLTSLTSSINSRPV